MQMAIEPREKFRFTAELPAEVLGALNDAARARMLRDTPLTPLEWLHSTQAGKDLWAEIVAGKKYIVRSTFDMNRIIKEKYKIATKAVTVNSKSVSKARDKVLCEILEDYFRDKNKNI